MGEGFYPCSFFYFFFLFFFFSRRWPVYFEKEKKGG
jgi:hypothetical protein